MKSGETTCFASSKIYDAVSLNIAQPPPRSRSLKKRKIAKRRYRHPITEMYSIFEKHAIDHFAERVEVAALFSPPSQPPGPAPTTRAETVPPLSDNPCDQTRRYRLAHFLQNLYWYESLLTSLIFLGKTAVQAKSEKLGFQLRDFLSTRKTIQR